MTPEEFYRLRDDRTNRIIDNPNYHELPVRLVADIETVKTLKGQVQILSAANMLARWCRQIEFGFPNTSLVGLLKRSGHDSLHDRIMAEVREAAPFGDFRLEPNPVAFTGYTLKAGSAYLRNEDVDFTIDADDWRAFAGRSHRTFSPGCVSENLVGSVFAACIGVADAFKVAIGLSDDTRVRNRVFSLADFNTKESALPSKVPSSCSKIQLGNTQLVGIGSVGSAVVYLLGMMPVMGTLHLIDLDDIEYSNLNRSPLFGFSDVGKAKVHVAAKYLHNVLEVETFVGSYDEYIDNHGRSASKLDLLLPLANEFGVRQTIEQNFPPLQVYGTTTADWGVNYHRHIPLLEDCSSCRFPPKFDPVPLVCSEAKVETKEEEQVDAALPFLSMAAAVLTVADLIKLQCVAKYPLTQNFAFIDFKGDLNFVCNYSKPRRNNCICAQRSVDIHRGCIDSTLFSPLSNLVSASG